MQEDRNRYQRGVRREQEGPKEEGEITVTERRQRNLHKVENIGEKAVPVEPSVTAMDLEGEVGDRAEIENLVTGLEQAMDLVGVGKGVTDKVCIWMQSEARQEECTLDHGAMSQVTWDVSSPGLLGGLIKPQTASMLFRQEWFWCSRERCIYSYIVA
ncbi:hypothetical protein YC2023_100285 [Brassica napus]